MAIPSKQFEEEREDWLVTYADAITLLMAFFVMLLTFAKYDIPAFEEAAAAIKTNIGKKETTSPIQLLKLNVQDIVYDMQADQVVKVEKDDKGIVIELASSAFYKPGSADIREEAMPVLEKMAQTLQAPKFQPYIIDIEGHTDDDPISTEKFPSNWELSAGRAARVVRFFAEQGIVPMRMKASGLADTHPKAPNRDAEGQAIKENQSKNRRVAVRVYPMSLDEKTEFNRIVEEQNRRQQAASGGGGQLPPADGQVPAQPTGTAATTPVGQIPAGPAQPVPSGEAIPAVPTPAAVEPARQ